MAKCEICGNDYDKSFTVTMDGASHVFDSFECAIHMLAPTCSHCGCRIMATAWRAMKSSIAVRTALPTPAPPKCGTARIRFDGPWREAEASGQSGRATSRSAW